MDPRTREQTVDLYSIRLSLSLSEQKMNRDTLIVTGQKLEMQPLIQQFWKQAYTLQLIQQFWKQAYT